MFFHVFFSVCCYCSLFWLKSAHGGNIHRPVWVDRGALARQPAATVDDLSSTEHMSPDSQEVMEELLPSRPSRSRIPLPHPSCRTAEKWTTLDHATDIFGNHVRVVQKFSQDNTLVDQNFYERYCENDSSADLPLTKNLKRPSMPVPSKVDRPTVGSTSEAGKCYGIDEDKYHGYCMTRYTFSYAKVVNQSGTVGWARIRIRGGCECAVFDKIHSQTDVLQYLTST